MSGLGEKRMVVAIDGPAGAGKSTVAQRLAQALGYVLLDTGAIYRAVALAAVRAGVAWDDETGVAALTESLTAREGLRLESAPEIGGKGVRVWLDGDDVTSELRTAEISLGASLVSSVPRVRAALLELQRALGASGGVVAEGRDIGTVVFPNANVKFFLTASVAIRSERRYDELMTSGHAADIDQVRGEVELRDRRDSERAVAPLRQAEDAILIDSGGRDVPDIVAELKDAVLRAAG